MTLKIATDSTCDLPQALIEQYDITVVPAYVHIGDKSYRDGVDLSRQQFYENLAHYTPYPTTAAPSSGVFAQAYERLTAEGATEILSIHVASTLSSIFNAAQGGAQLAQSAPVTVFDSRQLSMGLGFQVLWAAQAAAQGATVSNLVPRLQSMIGRTHIYCLLDGLEAVRRGGRISWLQMGMGQLLKIKPLVHVFDGDVQPVERVRTRKRALEKLITLVGQLGRVEQCALLDTNNPAELTQLATLLPTPIKALQPITSTACPAIGVHVGAGAMAIACVVAE